MRKLARKAYARLLATACVALLMVGCSEEIVDETEKELLAEWNGVVQRIAAARSMTRESSAHICKKVSDRTDGDQRKRILRKFFDMLHSIDISSLGLFDQLRSIDMAFDASYYLAREPDGLTDRERWQILLSALAWEHSQFIRIAHTDRSVFMKRNGKWDAQKRIIPETGIEDTALLRFPEDVSRPSSAMLQRTFDNITDRLKRQRYIRLDVVRRLATDIEDDRYSDEFREWARAEMEKVIGRPLTDDDYMFKEDVLRRREERKKRAHDDAVRKPRDGGDVLPHPFTIFGCTLGKVYDQDKRLGMSHNGRTIDSLLKNFRIDQYFGKDCVIARLAPRAKVAYSLEIEWQDVKTKADMLARVKDIKADIEKRLGVTLGGLFFEVDGHVCDESKWWSAPSAYVKSRSVFGPIMIEICAACKDRGTSYVKLEIIDKVAEALVEKERKENPLKYDREAERRRFERLQELGRQRKAMKDAQKPPQP